VWSILIGEPGDPSSLQLLDIFGTLVSSFTHRNAEVGKSPVVFFVTFRDRVEDFFIPTDPLLQVFDVLLIATPLLSIVCIALL
jgi:hypothetical protein